MRLQILARRNIFDAVGEVADYELISSFVHLCSILQDLFTPGSGDGSSEHVRLGVQILTKPPTDDVERFCLCESLIHGKNQNFGAL